MSRILIIAEIGVNHNGSFEKAKKLINKAKTSGADVVKFQYFKTDNLATKNLRLTPYQKKNNQYKNQFDMLNKLELSEEKIIKLSNYCKKKKIDFSLSFFSHLDLDIIHKCKIDYLKIPSGEINNYPLLKNIRLFRKKLIISTGMSTISEINNSIKILKNKNKNITILQCTSSYPAPFEDLNLKNISIFKKKFKLKIGFSDHTLGNEASIAAVALGAKVIEKHLTLNNDDRGPDHKASLEPDDFKKMVLSIRNIEKSLGDKKGVMKSERDNFYFVRKKIVANKKIFKGEKFTLKNIAIKRTNDKKGIEPNKFNLILNKRSKKNYEKNQAI